MERRGVGKGANAPIDGRRCTALVEAGGVAVDVVAFQLGGDGHVQSDSDVVFYNQPTTPDGAVQLTGRGAVTVQLDLLPPWVQTIAIAVAVGELTSSLPQHIDFSLTTEVAEYHCATAGLNTERAVVLVEIYRRNGSWKMRNVSAGWEQGLAALFAHHGVTVDDTTKESTEAPAGRTADEEALPGGALPHPPVPSPQQAPAFAPVPSPPQPPHPAPVPAPPQPPASGGPPPAGSPPPRTKTRKRVALLAAVVVAVLTLTVILGRSSISGRSSDGSREAAKPVADAQTTMSNASSSTSSFAGAVAAASSSRTPTTSTAVAVAEPVLPAPGVSATIQDRRSAQAAVTALQRLRVAGRAPKTGYARARFGRAWTDDVAVEGGHNGCDTRNDILRRDLTQRTIRAGSHGCVVTTGTFTDPYTGKPVQFSGGWATTVQIDHVVALSNAWQTGAAALSPQQRQNLANDPVNLQATASAVNQAKSDGDAATWLPPNKAYRCTYVTRQVAVKRKYGLWVTAGERQAISAVLAGCGATPATPFASPVPLSTRAIPTSTRPSAPPVRATTAAPTTRAGVTTTVEVPPVRTTAEPLTTQEATTTETTTASASEQTAPPTTSSDNGPYYKSCAEARAAGAAPLHRGDPGYRAGLDRDDDGISCE